MGTEVVFAGITAKLLTAPPFFVETGHDYPARLAPSVADEVLRTARAALAAVGMRFGPCHTEVKLTATGAAGDRDQPPARRGHDPGAACALTTGIDLLEQQVRAAAGKSVFFGPTTAAHAGIRFLTTELPGTLLRVDGTDRAERIRGDQAGHRSPSAAGRTVQRPHSAYDRLGYVVAAESSPAGSRPPWIWRCARSALW